LAVENYNLSLYHSWSSLRSIQY